MLDASNRANKDRAAELSHTTLPDHEGTEILLGDLWRHAPVALVWLRHYG